MNFHAITDKKDSYIQLAKTIVSLLILCLKKRWTPRRNSPNVGIAPRHPIQVSKITILDGQLKYDYKAWIQKGGG